MVISQTYQQVKGKKFTLQQLTEIPIKRHIKIRCEAKPFDPSWDEYFERRKLKSARQRA